MSINLDKKGLKFIADDFDLYFIDIWGVIHNGINLFKDAIEVLNQLENLKKEYVLLTNAPRPNATVISFLKKMGLDEIKSKKVYTSGEASINFLNSEYKNKKFFHIGTSKDFDLFSSLKKNKTDKISDSEFLLCTGLFDEYEKDLDYYKNLLKIYNDKKMICTNPDLIVERGDKKEFCAGSIAKVFENVGGEVEYFGKPYSKIYNLAANTNNKKILCIGDNLNTDIRGANIQKFNSLIISSGIHRNEFKNLSSELLLSKYKVKFDYIQFKLKW